MLLGALASYGAHFLWDGHVSFFTDFMLSSVVGGAVYIGALYQLKRLRGDF